MNSWKPAFALLLVFAAGIVLGAVGTRMIVQRDIRQMVANPGIVRERIELQLARRLRLDPMQRQRVNQVLARAQAQLRETRLQVQPRLQEITSNAQADINVILTPVQQREFERLKAENRPGLQTLFGPLPPRQ
jgi:hypothetical protein